METKQWKLFQCPPGGDYKETMGQLTSQNTTCVPVKRKEVIIPVQVQKLSITRSVKIMYPAEEDTQTVTIYVRSTTSLGEGTGNPLQYSCLENPMDGGAW